MTYLKFAEDFDPSDQKEYTWKFRLREGESILTAEIDPVDATATTVVVDSPIVFGPISFGVDSGTVWGVTQWLLPMADPTVSAFMAYLRCAITTDFATPLPHDYTRTMRLQVRQL